LKKIVYSPDAIERIQKIERQVRAEYGDKTARKVKKAITAKIRSLQTLEEQGVSMFDLYGVTPDYRRLFVAHNYVFYLIEGETIQIVNLYHEKALNCRFYTGGWELFRIVHRIKLNL
jgi:addiction module RelE/StbE family toxin